MKIKLYLHTLVFLKWQQIWFRLPVLKKIGRRVSKENIDEVKAGRIENWTPSIASHKSYQSGNKFCFLNQSHTFSGSIDWDFPDHGLLWTYNLNYFEYLCQKEMDLETGIRLIDAFLAGYNKLKAARDPYPISLRLIFWIRFFIGQDHRPKEKYLKALHQQAKELQSKLEFHLLGNHLLENAFALFFSGTYLRDNSILNQAKKLLQSQLKEQILPDGGHFELSPMYHQIMLYRLLDCINLTRAGTNKKAGEILPLMEQTASRMYGWMQQMTFKNGDFPLFNDAANGIAPKPNEIAAYANRLNLSPTKIPLKESGYRQWTTDDWEMIIDVGQPAVAYQAGHAHCDALSFELYIKNKAVLVDTGTSVYGGDSTRRNKERSTAAHNTVQIDGMEQSEIWGDFRMARRAKVKIQEERKNYLKAGHNGFLFKNTMHERTFNRNGNQIIIEDKIKSGSTSVARYHFHPDVIITPSLTDEFLFSFENGTVSFENANELKVFSFDYSPEFGKRIVSTGLEIVFTNNLKTTINIP